MAGGRWVGRGDKNGADGAAVEAMRTLISTVSMKGVVVIGEGEKDDAPMLFNGEAVGDGNGPECDVAVDPIDGTTLTAKGMSNAVSVLAVADRGSMYDPSAVFYMDKLVTGPEAADVVDIRLPVRENIRRIARAKNETPEDVTVMLDRPRHENLAREVREAGARLRFISDGDVAGAIMAARPDTGIDLLLGVGGTPEGIIAACAIKCLGGVIQVGCGRRTTTSASAPSTPVTTSTRSCPPTTSSPARTASSSPPGSPTASSCAVRYRAGGVITHSLVMRSKSGTIRHREPPPARQAAGLQRHRLRPRPRHGYAVSERILVIGEALIDRVRDIDGDVVEHPGGSPANVAAGLARLDHLVDFATRIGQDERGARIANHLTRHGVSLLEVSVGPNPSVAEAHLDPSGAAEYTFDLHWDLPRVSVPARQPRAHRVDRGGPRAGCRVRPRHAARGPCTRHDLLRPQRPDIMGDLDAVRPRVEEIVGLADVVKASDEDLALIYPARPCRRSCAAGPARAVPRRRDPGR